MALLSLGHAEHATAKGRNYYEFAREIGLQNQGAAPNGSFLQILSPLWRTDQENQVINIKEVVL